MKSVNKFFALILLGITMTVVACGQTDKKADVPKVENETAEQITADIGGEKLTLQNNDGNCQLLYGEQTIDLDVPWDCNFHRLPEGEIRVFPRDFYKFKDGPKPKDYRGVQIIIVEYSKPDAKNPDDCRTELQAVKISNGKITKSVKMGNLASCPPFQWDDINFIGAFK